MIRDISYTIHQCHAAAPISDSLPKCAGSSRASKQVPIVRGLSRIPWMASRKNAVDAYAVSETEGGGSGRWPMQLSGSSWEPWHSSLPQ